MHYLKKITPFQPNQNCRIKLAIKSGPTIQKQTNKHTYIEIQ